MFLLFFFFFFSSRRRHTRCGRDWSSDVCSSDLDAQAASVAGFEGLRPLIWPRNVSTPPTSVPPAMVYAKALPLTLKASNALNNIVLIFMMTHSLRSAPVGDQRHPVSIFSLPIP